MHFFPSQPNNNKWTSAVIDEWWLLMKDDRADKNYRLNFMTIVQYENIICKNYNHGCREVEKNEEKSLSSLSFETPCLSETGAIVWVFVANAGDSKATS